MKRFARLFFVTLVSIGLWSEVTQAAIIIDNFDVAQAKISDDTTGLPGASSIVADPGIFGGDRDLFVMKTGGGVGPEISAAVFPGSGVLSLDRGNGVFGTLIVQWDGTAADGDPGAPVINDPSSNLFAGLTSQDLTQSGVESGLRVQIVSAEAGQSIRLSIWGTGGIVSQTSFKAVPLIPLSNLDFFWAEFLGPVLPGAVRAITLEAISSNPAADMAIGQVATFAPEPAAATLLGLGIVPLWNRYRLRRRHQS